MSDEQEPKLPLTAYAKKVSAEHAFLYEEPPEEQFFYTGECEACEGECRGHEYLGKPAQNWTLKL